MKHAPFLSIASFVLLGSSTVSSLAQDADSREWLSSVKVPEFTAPASRDAWAAQRAQIRTTLIHEAQIHKEHTHEHRTHRW